MAVRTSRWLHRIKLCGIILSILLAADLLIDAFEWPFTRVASVSALEKVSKCDVKIGAYHKEFLPHPGYVADMVAFTRNGAAGPVPLATIQHLHCQGSWFAILSFTHRVSKIELDGAHLTIPKQIPPPLHENLKASLPTTVTDLFAPGAVLEIADSAGGGHCMRFDFPRLHLGNVARDKAIDFHIRMVNASLIGTADIDGSVGPLRMKNMKQTDLSGSFRLNSLDLSAYQGISGNASASGRFAGELSSLKVQSRAVIPDFEVKRSGHSQGLTAECRAVVNGMQGDVALQAVTVHFSSSTLLARGGISGHNAKTLELDVDSQHAEVQDLLGVFVQSRPSPLSGSFTMHTHLVVASGTEPFLERLRMNGRFEVANGKFASKSTEEKLAKLSARASGKKDQPIANSVLVRLGGNVELHREVATLSDAFFTLPGAMVRGEGTYNLQTEAIDLRGKLAMKAKLSQAATGIKSILAIPLDPLFAKDGAGAVVPVKVTGTYSDPKFKMSL